MSKPYPSELLTEIVHWLLDADLCPLQVMALAADLPKEFEATYDDRNEAAWEAYQERGYSGIDDETYRNALIGAGRGHLLKR